MNPHIDVFLCGGFFNLGVTMAKTEKKKTEKKTAPKRAFYIPAYNISVEAENIEEAIKIAKKGKE